MTLVGSYFDDNFQKQAVSDAKSALKVRVGQILGEERNKEIRHIVATGSIYEEILQLAEQADVDLIVIGAHKPDLREYLLGPNAARVCAILNVQFMWCVFRTRVDIARAKTKR